MEDEEEDSQGIAEEDGSDIIIPPSYSWAKTIEIFKCRGTDVERQHHTRSEQIFWRKLLWSPYGTHLLAQSDDHHVDLFELLQDEGTSNPSLKRVFSLRAPTTLLALEWYPFARYEDPTSWCFIMGCRDIPARLVDAYEGKTRASYGIINHVERFVGPQCIAFSLDGSRLYFGLEAEIAVFDLNRPGVNTHRRLQLTPPKKTIVKVMTVPGQKGLVSCFAVAQDHFAGTSGEVLAVGTFSGTIGLYSVEGNPFSKAEEICLLGWSEKSAGVAQLSFHPSAPHILFVTSRKDDEIRAYDLQYVGSRRSFVHPPEQMSLLATFPRCTAIKEQSQQRIGFAIDWAGRWLVAGNHLGSIFIWDIATPTPSDEAGHATTTSSKDNFFGRLLRNDESPVRNVFIRYEGIASDTIASVALHPIVPLIAVASGARYWNESREGVEDEKGDDYLVRDGAIRLLRAHIGNLPFRRQ